jgi:hypothetical protein
VRIVSEQRNLWGLQGERSPNVQRSDLWTVHLDNVVGGLNEQIRADAETTLTPLQYVQTYFAQSVTCPELKVNAEPFRRDSRPYMMPMQDDPLGAITIKFYLETPTNPQRSVVYQLLDTWRAYVRGGRGAYTQEGYVPTLNAEWKLTYSFNVLVSLYRGCLNSEVELVDTFSGISKNYYNDKRALIEELNALKDKDEKKIRLESLRSSIGVTDPPSLTNDLKKCGTFCFDKMWLSSFKLSELSYQQGNQIVTLDATFFAENIRDRTGEELP